MNLNKNWHGQVFARKVIRTVVSGPTEEEAKNEVRAIEKLSKDGGHPNIVPVLNHGAICDRYFFDMELCDFNLMDYIMKCREMTDGVGDSPVRFAETGCIFKDISHGIAFTHLQGEIHRDLKPRNGKRFYSLAS